MMDSMSLLRLSVIIVCLAGCIGTGIVIRGHLRARKRQRHTARFGGLAGRPGRRTDSAGGDDGGMFVIMHGASSTGPGCSGLGGVSSGSCSGGSGDSGGGDGGGGGD